MTVQKIKVSRQKLIERIKEVQEVDIKVYEADLVAYPRAVTDYDKQITAIVRDLADKVKSDPVYRTEIDINNYSHHRSIGLPYKGEFPKKPDEPKYPTQHDTAIRQLELAADETLSIEINGSYRMYL